MTVHFISLASGLGNGVTHFVSRGDKICQVSSRKAEGEISPGGRAEVNRNRLRSVEFNSAGNRFMAW